MPNVTNEILLQGPQMDFKHIFFTWLRQILTFCITWCQKNSMGLTTILLMLITSVLWPSVAKKKTQIPHRCYVGEIIFWHSS